MPELPEVEAARRAIEKALKGRRIASVEAFDDPIVLKGLSEEKLRSALVGKKVIGAGRKGKFFWIELDEPPHVCAHFGMSGWYDVLEKGAEVPKFAKLRITVEDGTGISLRDGRRLGRIWLCDDPATDERIAALGRDVLADLPSAKELQSMLGKRTAPIKALLLDQTLFAGVGNYMADEILYQSRISPKREGGSLSAGELKKLHAEIQKVTEVAVEHAARDEDPPEDWLFHIRWGRRKEPPKINGHAVVRETIGGRTTAWVPDLQK